MNGTDSHSDMKTGSKCVILFAKAPVAGRVKTRLMPQIRPDDAALLYRSFVLDLRDMLARSEFTVRVYFEPPRSHDALADLIGHEYTYLPQKGAGLGEKMAGALKQTFDVGFDAAVLIGTDFPDLPAVFIADAFAALSRSSAVIGPSVDDGYYLIGFTKNTYCREVFDNIPWGSNRVLEETLSAFTRRGIDVFKLPPWRDIDTFDDLLQFIDKNAANPENSPYTFDCLEKMGLLDPKMTAR